ncbi:hypothetical protein [Ottowia oryzae]
MRGLLLVAWVAQWLARQALARGLARLAAHTQRGVVAVLLNPGVLSRAAQIVLTLVIQLGMGLVEHLPPTLVTVVQNVAAALTVLCIARTLIEVLSVTQIVHQQRALAEGTERSRSIKSYIQLGQLVVGAAAVVVMIAALADKSPLIGLSGFGAMSAAASVFWTTKRSTGRARSN